MFAVTVKFDISPDMFEAFLPLIKANAQASVTQEPGCNVFDVCTDPSRPNEVFLYELYSDEAAFRNHMQQPHFMTFEAEAGGMILSKSVATFSEVTR